MVNYVGKEYFIVVQNPTLASSLCNPGARDKGSMEQGLGVRVSVLVQILVVLFMACVTLTSHVTPLSFSSLICKMGLMMLHPSWGSYEGERRKLSKAL